MMNTKYHIGAFVCCICALALFSAFEFYKNTSTKIIPMSSERELKATLQAGFGDVSISAGNSSSVLNAEVDAGTTLDLTDCIDYRVRDRVGYLNMSMDCSPAHNSDGGRRHKSIHFDNLETRNWRVQFTNAVPIAFDIELGLGKGDIDMTGLRVKDFSLSTGASSVKLRFDKPNPETIEEMNLEAGVSKFTAEGLCNARFQHLKFDGGVGSYTLDFGGELEKEIDADIEVGLGTLTIIIPEHTGAKLIYEKSWVAHLDLAGDFEESGTQENTYYSANYSNAKGKINLRIDAGMGSVRIRRADW